MQVAPALPHDAAQAPSPSQAPEQQTAVDGHAAPIGSQVPPLSVPLSGGQHGTGWPQLSMQVGLQVIAIGAQHVP